jgi:hypothetical protein
MPAWSERLASDDRREQLEDVLDVARMVPGESRAGIGSLEVRPIDHAVAASRSAFAATWCAIIVPAAAIAIP